MTPKSTLITPIFSPKPKRIKATLKPVGQRKAQMPRAVSQRLLLEYVRDYPNRNMSEAALKLGWSREKVENIHAQLRGSIRFGGMTLREQVMV